MRRKGFIGGEAEGTPIKRPWLCLFPKALTCDPCLPLFLFSIPFSLLLSPLSSFLYVPQGEDGFPGFKGDGGPKGDRVRPALDELCGENTVG